MHTHNLHLHLRPTRVLKQQLQCRWPRRLAGPAPSCTGPQRRVKPLAVYHNKGPQPQAGQDAQAAVRRILDLCILRDREGLVDYLQNENLQDVPSLKLPGDVEVVLFENVMENMLLQSPSKHFLDSYGVRHLVLTPPSRFQVLSGLLLASGKYVQRVGVVSPTGEECILTFTMAASPAQPPSQAQQPPVSPAPPLAPPATAAAATQDPNISSTAPAVEASMSGSLPPASSNVPEASAPSSSDEDGGHPCQVWRLCSVRGERQLHSDDAVGPSPELPPEVVVEAHLAALQRRDFSAAFDFFSPASKKVLGSEQQFTANTTKHRRYSSMLGHIAATTVRRCQTSASMYLEIVAVTSASGSRFVFCYIVSQQVDEGPFKDCWLIEYIKIVEDAKLLAAVEHSIKTEK